jgi:cell wall-associated NlpC family hydrolase
VLAVAQKYIGLPYRHHPVPGWAPAGAADPKEAGNGLDCSNFSAWVYNYGLGIKVTSEIGKQSQGAGAPGRLLAAGEAFEPGDLLFILKSDRTCVSHVVIYLDDEHIIDSTVGGVAVREFKGWYKTHLSHARRVLE